MEFQTLPASSTLLLMSQIPACLAPLSQKTRLLVTAAHDKSPVFLGRRNGYWVPKPNTCPLHLESLGAGKRKQSGGWGEEVKKEWKVGLGHINTQNQVFKNLHVIFSLFQFLLTSPLLTVILPHNINCEASVSYKMGKMKAHTSQSVRIK